MSSSMLAGERRPRRGGMTVLGRVAVPKPLNLPSQRLENHGLDPNVEIVPKGSLSWGSRSSSSGSNAWISSWLSPNADGGATSPSHLSGRPSSGGSGTRPSTAGSDRTHEPVASAWGPNSRPSSASGTLAPNQTSSSSLRPRSAETRPSSSHLSRFAEPVSESSVAWGPSSAAERLGVKSSKDDGFSLSSGDFPTLGSEKDSSVKNFESQDHDCPSSASGRIAKAAEKDSKSQADAKHENVNAWRTGGSQSAEDGIHPNIENWQGEPHQYFNSNLTPQHFDAWHGPPINAPAGVWYRGRPRGPAFGASVAPGGFPMEPFPYYHPQIQPPGSQPVLPQRAGPRGTHPKNGDSYRPHMPDAYAHQSMPFRPGFYPGPPGPMAFEGYYGPPMGYCNNERDIPYRGMAAGPPVYNGYPAPSASDIDNSHGRAGGHGPAGKTMSAQVKADHLADIHGPRRVPVKNPNEWDQKEEGESWEHDIQTNVSYPGKHCLPMITSRKNEWGAEEENEEDKFSRRTTPSENSSGSFAHRGHSSDGIKVKSVEGMGNMKSVNDSWTNKSGSVASFRPEMPQLPLASERDLSLQAATKDIALMQKIEGLNAKVRASDGRNDAPSAYNKEEQRSRSEVDDLKINNYLGEVGNTAGSLKKTPVSGDFVHVPHEAIVPVGNKPIEPITVMSRRSYHGGLGRVDHRGKGKFNSQDVDGWPRKPITPEFSSANAASVINSASDIRAHGPNFDGGSAENYVINPAETNEGEFVAETCDSTDIQAQRAKMRELAKQRALQLQKAEEERIREQRAKAFAKLEELNRRAQAGEAANQKAEKTQAIAEIQGEQKESCTVGEPVMGDRKFQAPRANLVSNPGVTAEERDGSTSQPGESVEVSRNLPLEIPQTGPLESNVPHGHSLPMKEDAYNANARKVAPQLNDGVMPRNKRTGYKRKQNNSSQKSLNEKSVSNVASEAQKDHTHITAIEFTSTEAPLTEVKPSGESTVPNVSNTVAEPMTHQREKSNRSSKNKHKKDEIPAVPALPPLMLDINPGKESIENGESKASLANLDSSVSTVIEPDRGLEAQDASSSLPKEEVQSRGTNQWKPLPSRRMPRSQQTNRFTDKLHSGDAVMWAPVRTQNNAQCGVEENQKSTMESANPTKSDNAAHNSSKGKRAEIERYVPKPVAKELAQQGTIPTLSSSISSSGSDEAPGSGQSGSVSSASLQQPVSSATAFVGSSVEIMEGDARHNKHKKEHGTWRQRGTTDSSHTKGLHLGPSPISEPSKDIQQSMEHNQSVKCGMNSATPETKTSGNAETSDGYNTSMSTTAAAVSKSPAVKDQGATGRGKRHLPRGPRSTGNNPDHENFFSGETDGSRVQSAAPDVNQTDRTSASKENRIIGERTSSHWQPKSHSTSATNQQGNRTSGSEIVTTEVNKLSKKDHPQCGVQVSHRHDKESSNIDRAQPDQSFFESNVAEELIVGHHQEFNREKKPAPAAKRHSYSLNQDPVGSGELASATYTDDQYERNISSGSRRNGSHNNRSARGHESRGDWSSGQDNRPHNIPAYRERQRQYVQYEYQPIGPNKSSKPEKLDAPPDEANNWSPRYRERGPSNSKRGGHFNRRQSGAVRVDSGQDRLGSEI